MKIGLIIGSVILVLFLVFCLVPLKEVSYAVTVEYEDTETYYEEQPYESSETHTNSIPLQYRVTDAHDYIENGKPVLCVSLKNEDDSPGIFCIRFIIELSTISIGSGAINITSGTFHDQIELDLDPAEIETAIYLLNLNAQSDNWSWGYEVIPDTKDVDTAVMVTKYLRVEKQRPVTRQRPETHYRSVTLLDYLLHYY